MSLAYNLLNLILTMVLEGKTFLILSHIKIKISSLDEDLFL